MELPTPTPIQETVYEALRRKCQEIIDYAEVSEAELTRLIEWHASSLSRFLKGQTATMPHDVAVKLETVYSERREAIEPKKLEHINRLLQSLDAKFLPRRSQP